MEDYDTQEVFSPNPRRMLLSRSGYLFPASINTMLASCQEHIVKSSLKFCHLQLRPQLAASWEHNLSQLISEKKNRENKNVLNKVTDCFSSSLNRCTAQSTSTNQLQAGINEMIFNILYVESGVIHVRVHFS